MSANKRLKKNESNDPTSQLIFPSLIRAHLDMLSALIILGIEDIFTWINYSYEDLMSKVQSSNKQSHSICFPAQGKFRTFYNVLYTLYLYDSIKVFVFFPMLW